MSCRYGAVALRGCGIVHVDLFSPAVLEVIVLFWLYTCIHCWALHARREMTSISRHLSGAFVRTGEGEILALTLKWAPKSAGQGGRRRSFGLSGGMHSPKLSRGRLGRPLLENG